MKGVRVVEVCTVASGPFAGMLLADLGADVVKIENPRGGDTLRSWPPHNDGFSENFTSLNRNKRSAALDLKAEEDRDDALALMCQADVVVENNRPGVMDRLGLGFADVKALRPSIVYCSISAYGQRGSRRGQAGFDLTVQAMSGIMSVTGEPGREPVKCGVPVADFATGLYAAMAVAAALLEARETGRGVHIDASMLGSSLGIAALQTSQLIGTGVDPVALGAAHPRNAPYEVFACADGYVAMAAGNDGLFTRFCESFGRGDLLTDPRFATTALRAEHQAALKGVVEGLFAAVTRADLLSQLERAGVPASPINSYSEALADPQVDDMGWLRDLDTPSGRATSTVGSPLRFDGEDPTSYVRAPVLGEHTDELRHEARALRGSVS